MQQRVADFERDDLALFQARPQNMLGGGFNAADQNAVGGHAAGNSDRGLVRAQFCLEDNLFEPVHAALSRFG